MFRFCTLLLLVGAGGNPVVAASPDPKSLVVPPADIAKARDLVEKLGNDEFAVREDAERELARMGRLARVALLEAATNDPSTEVRSRCLTLLPKATSLELKARLETFLADADGKYEHDLPGWDGFRSLARNEWSIFGYPVYANRSLDRAAREVFADLLATSANRQILLAASGYQPELGGLVATRRQELYSQKYPRAVFINGMVTQPGLRREPTAADITTLLFGESLVPNNVPPRTAPISVLLSASGFMSAAQNPDDKGKVYRAIAIAWLDSRKDPVDMTYATTVASSLGLPEHACRIAARIFEAKGAVVYQRGNAAAILARLGNKSHLPLLEKALGESTVLTSIRVNVPGKPVNEWPVHEVQIRDVALAVSLILSGEKLEDYGFTDQYKANGVGGATYSYTRYYLTEANRPEALVKFGFWKLKQSLKGVPAAP